MHTEITEYKKEWLFYDADCALCTAWAARLAKTLANRQIAIVPLQSQAAKALLSAQEFPRGLGVRQSAAALPQSESTNKDFTEIKLLTTSGQILGGADALIHLAQYFWWGWGVRLLARLPGVRFVLRRAYAALAKRRHCLRKGGCRL